MSRSEDLLNKTKFRIGPMPWEAQQAQSEWLLEQFDNHTKVTTFRNYDGDEYLIHTRYTPTIENERDISWPRPMAVFISDDDDEDWDEESTAYSYRFFNETLFPETVVVDDVIWIRSVSHGHMTYDILLLEHFYVIASGVVSINRDAGTDAKDQIKETMRKTLNSDKVHSDRVLIELALRDMILGS